MIVDALRGRIIPIVNRVVSPISRKFDLTYDINIHDFTG